MDPPFISPATLPSAATIEFKASSFFSRHPALPSPADVRAFASSPEGIAQRAAHRRMHFTIMFPHLGLLVKWGRHITIAEGQCMWACRHLLSGIIPVPEIYGWVTDKDHGDTEVFIYMEVIKGVTLENRWPVMSTEDKLAVSCQLRDILSSMRKIRQDPADPFLGHVGRQPLLDVIFTENMITGGPFHSVCELNDFLARMYLMRRKDFDPNAPFLEPEYRSQLPDDGPITFTHSDLHPSNIMISSPDDGPTRILALIDWHQSGWYPSYWEWCKMSWCVPYDEEWCAEYVPKILTPEEAYIPWRYYTLSLGM